MGKNVHGRHLLCKHGASPCSLASLALISTSQTFDDLVYVSSDRSPTIGRLYVPERVTQAAYWTQSMLRHKIVGHSLSSPPSSPSLTGAIRHKELGISVTQNDIKEELSQQEKGEESRTYWPVPGSSSLRIGECAGVENVPTDEFPGLPSVSSRHSPSRSSMSVDRKSVV